MTDNNSESFPSAGNRGPHRESLVDRGEAIAVPGPAALITAVPYLLGYWPRDRIVLTVLDELGTVDRLIVGVRTGAPDDWPLSQVFGFLPDEARIRLVVSIWGPTPDDVCDGAEHQLTDVITNAPDPRDIERDCSRLGAELLDVLVVASGNWRSLLCVDTLCCPASGRPLGQDGDAMRVAAEFVGRGRAIREHVGSAGDHRGDSSLRRRGPDGSREETPLGAGSEVERRRIRTRLQDAGKAPRTVSGREALLSTAWAAIQEGGSAGTEMAPTVIVAADSRAIRDALLARMARCGIAEAQHWDRWAQALGRITRLAPGGHVSGVAALAAVASWQAEDIAMARRVLDLGLADDPTNRLCLLLSRAIEADLPQHVWANSAAGLSEQLCLGFEAEAA